MKSDCRATHVSLSHAWLTVNGVEMYTQNACLKTLTYYKTIVQVSRVYMHITEKKGRRVAMHSKELAMCVGTDTHTRLK